MLRLVQTSLFKKQLKLMRKRGVDLDELRNVTELLAKRKTLPAHYRDHALTGNRKGLRDCHIKPDWVLLYEVREDELLLVLVQTGSHSDLGL